MKQREYRCRKGKHGHAVKGKFTPTYKSWQSMVKRCFSPANASYRLYGAKGIKVCDRWMEFANFLTDMGEKPEGYFIERLKNERGYEPGNCIWATNIQQQQNKKTSRLITFAGETHCVAEWARRIGITRQALRHRLANEPVQEALSAEKRKPGRPRRVQ